MNEEASSDAEDCQKPDFDTENWQLESDEEGKGGGVVHAFSLSLSLSLSLSNSLNISTYIYIYIYKSHVGKWTHAQTFGPATVGFVLRHAGDAAEIVDGDTSDADQQAALQKSLKSVSWPEMDDDAQPSSYVTKVLTCLSKWQLKVNTLQLTLGQSDIQQGEAVRLFLGPCWLMRRQRAI